MTLDAHPCPSCGHRSPRVALVGERADLALECPECGLRGPRARSVDLESLPDLASCFEPGRDHPDDVECARLGWNAVAHRASLGKFTVDLALSL